MARKTSSILVWMVIAILALGAVALWDEQRESAAAMADFAREQSVLARAVAEALSAQLTAARRASGGGGALESTKAAGRGGGPISPVSPVSALSGAADDVERPGELIALLQRPNGELVESSGQVVMSDDIRRAIRKGRPSVRLTRSEAAALGLPPRTAVAGLSTISDRAAGGKWTVAVVATASHERDREVRAVWRLVLGFSFVSTLILAFGGLALRTQRKELALAHELAMAEALRVRDERLVRADKLATLGALAMGIAHEVSTPLGVIVGRAEQLLPKVDDDGKTKKAVEVIARQAERISQIIRAFLRLARGGAPSLERVPPPSIAEAAVDLVEHRFRKAGVHLLRRISDDLPRVACDPKLFEQVLVNLLLNACDACSEGGEVELAVTADDERVVFVVTDDGVGIAPDAAKRATEPFFTTKPEGQGTGLGLAIANEIVKHHHGELSIRPRTDGRGTRATVHMAATREGA